MYMHMIIDGQWGSTGKGKLAWYLHTQDPYTAAVTDNGPNAGHTIADKKRFSGTLVYRQLPVLASDPGVRVFLGPGTVIDPTLFVNEVRQAHRPERIFVHPRAAVVFPGDCAESAVNSRHVSGTGKGTCEAQCGKMHRIPGRIAAQNPTLAEFTSRYEEEWSKLMLSNERCLAETAQGFDLSNSGPFYPYTTSRDINVSACLDRCGISNPNVVHGLTVYGSLRLHPIRVGSLPNSSSGPCYDDQTELTWGQLGVDPEITTVTKRVRRIFTWSPKQFQRFKNVCRPDVLMLNFTQYSFASLPQPDAVEGLREWIKRSCGTGYYLVGYGQDNADMLELVVD